MHNVDVSTERYKLIREKIRQAVANNDKRQSTLWKRKLEEWQLAYGAYAPIGGVRV